MDTELLKAPLEHVKRQFRQNCHFQFDGALFLSTPSLLAEIAAQAESTTPVLLAANGDPVLVEPTRFTALRAVALSTLQKAANTFVTQKALCDSQFAKKLQLEPLPNEETE